MVPSYYNCGNRFVNVIQTRIRHNCSSLKSDLFRVNICDSPCCDCGQPVEDAYHYFFVCNRYAIHRQNLILNILDLHNFIVIDTRLLLWGDQNLPEDINIRLFKLVHVFIKETKRFS